MDRVTDQHGDAEDTVLRAGTRRTPSRPTPTGGPATATDVDDTVLVRASWADSSAAPAPPAPAPPTRAPAPAADTRRVHAVHVAGAVLRLDRPVVVGRRPSAARVPRGATPQLVTVPSPAGQVSSTHLDVRQEGDVVVVTDLRSTNGTRVSAPGRPPVVLRQGESLVVLAGSLVDLGDGVVVEVLPPQRLTLEEGSRP